MATFISLSLLLLCLTTGDLFSRADGAAVDSICSETKRPPRCESLLRATDTRTPTADLKLLGEIAITAATDATGKAKISVQNLGLAAKDPNLKSLYRKCEDLYRSGLDELLMAPGSVQNRDYRKALAVARDVNNDAFGCMSAAGNDAGLKQLNDDVMLLTDALTVIVDTII